MCPSHPCGASPAVAGHESPPFRRDTKRPLRGLHESHGNMTIRPSLFQLFTFQLFNLAFRVRVRPKADFVSREAGFRVRRKRRRCSHRKGMGWRRPCSHGTAQSLARRTANGSPPRRWLSWSRASASRNDGFPSLAPTLMHEASFFICAGISGRRAGPRSRLCRKGASPSPRPNRRQSGLRRRVRRRV